jgi:adenylate kinase family enzyme
MRKLVIFGNSGAGKSTLALQLAHEEKLAHLDLDTLAWEPSSPPRRRRRADRHFWDNYLDSRRQLQFLIRQHPFDSRYSCSACNRRAFVTDSPVRALELQAARPCSVAGELSAMRLQPPPALHPAPQ